MRRLGARLLLAAALAMALAACGSDGPSTTARSSSAVGSRTSASGSGSGGGGISTDACGQPSSSGSGSASSSSAASSGAPTLAVAQVAKVAGSVTSMATRCQEDALYVTEQRGVVARIDLAAGPGADATSVLDLTGLVKAGGEQGLLGLAFSPAGDQLYVAYTNKAADQELARYAVADGTVDAGSRTSVLVIPDFAPNHNGGQLVFGTDGFLYWGMGDGGGGGDSTKHTGQDPTDLLGNILRLDVLHPAGGKQYGIPADNPFADGKQGAPEVYAYGLRNPWKLSFDRRTDDLWIGDVGQNAWEEIDHVAAGKGLGANFGWSLVEGTHSFNGGSNPSGGVLPVYEYDHSKGGCAVIGGYVYRGTAVAGLDGVYLFGDNCGGLIEGLRLGADGKATPVDIGLGIGGLSTFGQDLDGELYAASVDGTVVRITGA